MFTKLKISILSILFLYFFFPNYFCLAERIVEPAFTRYTTKDGLSLNKVNFLLPGLYGKMYIATDNSVDLFDGIDFKTIDASQHWSIGVEKIYFQSPSEIVSIDESGTIQKYDLLNSTRQELLDQKMEIRSELSTQTNNGTIYFVSINKAESSLYKLNGDTINKIFQIGQLDIKMLDCNEITCIFVTERGSHLLDLTALDFEKETLTPFLTDKTITFVKYLNDNLYLFTKSGELYKNGTHSDLVLLAKLPEGVSITSFLIDSNGSYWIGSKRSGLFWKPADVKDVYSLKHESFDHFSIPDNSIYDVKEDIFGVLWIATDIGLAKLDIPRMELGHIRFNQSVFGLNQRSISSIYELSSGDLLVGSRDQISLFDTNGKRIKDIRARQLKKRRTRFMNQINNREVILGTSCGLSKLDIESEIIVDYIHSKECGNIGISSSDIFDKIEVFRFLFIDNSKVLLGTTQHGLLIYDIENDSTTKIKSENKVVDVNSIYKDANNRIWIAHADGLNLIIPEESIFESKSVALLEQISVSSIAQISETKFWIGTIGKGLYQLDLLSNRLEIFKVKGVKLNPYINGMLQTDNQLWVSFDKGLMKIDNHTTTNKKATLLDYSDGLQDIEFNLGLFHKGNSGNIYFGGVQGLNAFNPERMNKTNRASIVGLSVKLSNSKEYDFNYGLPTEIHESELPISITLQSIHTKVPEKNRIRYKLSGIANDWIYSDTAKFSFTLFDLPEGKHELIVESAGYRSKWSNVDTRWKFFIAPFWWKTKWALLSYGVIVSLIVILLVALRLQQLKRNQRQLEFEVLKRTEVIVSQKQVIEKQYQKLDSLAKSKEIFFENLSHEFKTPLTLVLGPIKKLSSKYDSSDDSRMFQVAEKNANKVLNMVEQLLTISRLKSGLSNISKTNVKLSEFVQSKISEFQFLIEQKSITVHIDQLKSTNVLIDRDSLDKILNNLLSNAIKYNVRGGFIKIQYKEMQNKIQVDITNSVPLDEQIIPDSIFNRFYREDTVERGSGIGLSFTRELVEQNGGEIAVHQSNATEVSFQLLLELSNCLEEQVLHTQNNAQSVGSNKIKILLIEDDEDMRFYIKQELSEYTIETASDGVEGVALAKKSIPDIVISDIMMPRLDGYGVIEELSNHQLTSHIPLILLTAKSSAASKIRGFKAGALEYLKKPFDANELRLRIANIVRLQAQSVKSYRGLLQPNSAKSEMTIDRDKDFVQQCFEHLEQNYSTPEFDGKLFAQMENMSERQFQRKSKALFELSPSALIKEFRLKKAAEELLKGHGITTVCFSCGFIDTAHFSRVFKQKHRLSPTEYKKLNGE